MVNDAPATRSWGGSRAADQPRVFSYVGPCLGFRGGTCLGVAPRALLFSEPIDTLAASGVILADVWLSKRIVVVDRLGQEFLEYVHDGQPLEVRTDGTVIAG